MTALLIIIAIAVLIFLYIFKTQREFVSLEEKMKNAYGQINVQQKTRWDAVTNLVEMTKQYTQHEHDTLVDVISKRRIDNATPEQIADQDNAIQSVLSRLNAVAEAYPDLKANQMFIDTMASIRQYEENVRTSRMVYNDSVTKLNMMVRQWPSSIVASMLHFTTHDLLPEDAAKADAPSVSDIFNK
ncbi:MAG: LemA family protein [Bacteroidales bacterium]|jgi:LemA protein|nr:LemA family protein [Bacteroidales bacterium]